MTRPLKTIVLFAFGLTLIESAGCGTPEQHPRDFHTSGSREADQRAEQRVAKSQQLRGEGVGKDKDAAAAKKSLYERLGGQEGLTQIVEDWVNRAIADPRVNFVRKGVKSGTNFSIVRHSVEWNPTPVNGTRLKAHLVQFLAVATGGPPRYEGRDMKEVHNQMNISNPEFDAAVGDLAATMENLKIGTTEQKELLAAVETSRSQVVTKR